MRLTRLRIRNFKGLADFEISDLPRFIVLFGPNGSGKTTLFQALSFLKLCVAAGVRFAEESFSTVRQLRTFGSSRPIDFVLNFEYEIEGGMSEHAVYALQLDIHNSDTGFIKFESLSTGPRDGQNPVFTRQNETVHFYGGMHYALRNKERLADEFIPIESGSSVLNLIWMLSAGPLKMITAFIQNWHLTRIDLEKLRGARRFSYEPRLSINGDNLPQVLGTRSEQNPEEWSQLQENFASRVPGISGIQTRVQHNELSTRFIDEATGTEFDDINASDGSLRLLAHMVLLREPEKHPLLFVEEPENLIFPTLLRELAEDFEQYTRKGGEAQVIVTTHSPDFLDGVDLESIFWLEKSEGVTRVHRASDDPQLVELAKVGDRPGALWRQGQYKGTVLL